MATAALPSTQTGTMPSLQDTSATVEDLVGVAQRALAMVREVRGRMLSPTSRKNPPTYSAVQLAALCGIDRSTVTKRAAKGDLPQGEQRGSNRREFALPDVRQWARAYGVGKYRPAGAPGFVVATGNFKGGSTKTTTSMTLAQGLSLRGHRVLAVDLDPQGSLTTLFGVLPDTEVDENETLAMLAYGDQSSVEYAIRPTYWDGLDLIPASPALFGAEFALPAQQARDPKFAFWNVLNAALQTARQTYDVIILDTPPALSYLTINALMAADGLIVPLPPNPLDFASLAQFWNLFSDTAMSIEGVAPVSKRYEFVRILLSRVDVNDVAAGFVKGWIASTYGGRVMPVEIPKTAVASASSAEFGTVYDVSHYAGSARTYQRAREAYDQFVALIEEAMASSTMWSGHKAV